MQVVRHGQPRARRATHHVLHLRLRLAEARRLGNGACQEQVSLDTIHTLTPGTATAAATATAAGICRCQAAHDEASIAAPLVPGQLRAREQHAVPQVRPAVDHAVVARGVRCVQRLHGMRVGLWVEGYQLVGAAGLGGGSGFASGSREAKSAAAFTGLHAEQAHLHRVLVDVARPLPAVLTVQALPLCDMHTCFR